MKRTYLCDDSTAQETALDSVIIDFKRLTQIFFGG